MSASARVLKYCLYCIYVLCTVCYLGLSGIVYFISGYQVIFYKVKKYYSQQDVLYAGKNCCMQLLVRIFAVALFKIVLLAFRSDCSPSQKYYVPVLMGSTTYD